MNTRELLAKWDAGEEIEAVSMGGLGEDYERAIYATAMILIRASLDLIDEDPEAKPDAKEIWANSKKAPGYDGGITGAMFGAACNITSMFVFTGYEEAIKQAPPNRLIRISRQ